MATRYAYTNVTSEPAERVPVTSQLLSTLHDLRERGFGTYEIARRSGASGRALYNVLHGASTIRTTDLEAIFSAVEDGMFEEETLDEVLLDRLIDGYWEPVPRCSKHLYAKELFARGYHTGAVAKILHTSWGWASQWRPRT